MKKTLCTLLVLCGLLLSACGGNTTVDPIPTKSQSDNTVPTDTATETEPADRTYLDDLPDGLDYGGYDFRVLVYEGGNLPTGDTGAWLNYFALEGETGEPINDAAWKRNLAVEDRLNVKITAHEDAGWGNVLKLLSQTVKAGEDTYDLVCPPSTESYTALIREDSLYDVAQSKYMDLEKGYYSKQMIDTYRLGSHVYLFTGSYPYPIFGSPYMVVNLDAWNDRGLPDPYELVRSGEWTHAKFMECIANAYEDTNGDGKRDATDFYGMGTNNASAVLKFMFHSYGGSVVETTSDGFTFTLNSEKSQRIVEKLVEIAASDGFREKLTLEDGNFLLYLYPSSFFRLRDLTFNYGILPSPKLDETQENYITYACGSVLSVPVTVSDPDRTTAIIEALYAATHTYMADVFTTTFVENKLLRDKGSQEMYRLITETASYEFTRNIDPTNGVYYNMKPLENLIAKKSTDLSSAWAKIEEKVTTAYTEFYAEAAN